jgi:hypothetical protein
MSFLSARLTKLRVAIGAGANRAWPSGARRRHAPPRRTTAGTTGIVPGSEHERAIARQREIEHQRALERAPAKPRLRSEWYQHHRFAPPGASRAVVLSLGRQASAEHPQQGTAALAHRPARRSQRFSHAVQFL